MATPNQEQIAKDILIAALDKGAIIFPARPVAENDDNLLKHNQKRAKHIAEFYKIILEAVEKGTGEKGDRPRPITVI